MDVDEHCCDFTHHLISAGALSTLWWWLSVSPRTSDWLWSPYALLGGDSTSATMYHSLMYDHLEYARQSAICTRNAESASHQSIVKLMQAAVNEFNSVRLPQLRADLEAHLIPDLAAIVMRMLAPPVTRASSFV
jgi:hypothetical protein